MKKLLIIRMAVLSAAVFALAACGSTKPILRPSHKIFNLALAEEPFANRFVDLDYGIRLNVKDNRTYPEVLRKYDANLVSKPQVELAPELLPFVSESTRRYMRTMGFDMDVDMATDYLMVLSVKEFNVGYLSGVGWSAAVQLNVEVYDRDRRLVYPNVAAVGRESAKAPSSDFATGNEVLNRAYTNALKDIDWDRVAFFLKKSSSPKLEKNKQVTGSGETALESTVIRWYIDSAPKGADVSTRVVSSTPEVKNTNQNYVGSTPYETTETFDIKGLTYNNSGDVQIEVTCEKAGYITQKKRFNLHQAIDQKEISTKFNLVKEE